MRREGRHGGRERGECADAKDDRFGPGRRRKRRARLRDLPALGSQLREYLPYPRSDAKAAETVAVELKNTVRTGCKARDVRDRPAVETAVSDVASGCGAFETAVFASGVSIGSNEWSICRKRRARDVVWGQPQLSTTFTRFPAGSRKKKRRSPQLSLTGP